MKKLILFVVLCVASAAAFAQVNLADVIKPGTKLTYAVEAEGKKYDFIVTVKKLSPDVVFDWEMTAPAGINGTLTNTAKALQTANTMYNFFQPGDKQLDDETTSVWLSQATFGGLYKEVKGTPIRMNVGEDAKYMGVTDGDNQLDVLINGKKQKVSESRAKEIKEGAHAGDDYFTFATSSKMPIILRMQNGFYIALKEIKTK